jgi:hypothetical protein
VAMHMWHCMELKMFYEASSWARAAMWEEASRLQHKMKVQLSLFTFHITQKTETGLSNSPYNVTSFMNSAKRKTFLFCFNWWQKYWYKEINMYFINSLQSTWTFY